MIRYNQPKSTYCLILLGDIYLENNKIYQAFQCYNEAIDSKKCTKQEEVRMHNALSSILEKNGFLQDAEKQKRIAISKEAA
jgi:predicted Zn-dependent protease